MDKALYYGLGFLAFAFCVFFSYVLLDREGRFASLPRARWAGALLGVPCLAWSAWHGCIMLEGSLARFHALAWALVPVTAVLAWKFLDYLFARAAGGFFVLAANELLRQSFAQGAALRPLYSLACLSLGVVGLFLIGAPWRMRDAIELSGRNPCFSRCAAGGFFFLSIVLLVLPLC